MAINGSCTACLERRDCSTSKSLHHDSPITSAMHHAQHKCERYQRHGYLQTFFFFFSKHTPEAEKVSLYVTLRVLRPDHIASSQVSASALISSALMPTDQVRKGQAKGCQSSCVEEE
mmetsp:Transcript_107237/g.181201  ORF Transcript_107237/g.181201 Transcript_107237/m.181201 type:complete len:117 (-) Transcript_107237:2115-2465(-)